MPDETPAQNSRSEKKRPRRRMRRAAREEHFSYLARITEWNYHYSFHVSDPKSRWDPGPYSEFRTISFTGEVIRPEGCKFKRATITFSARANLMEDKAPSSIGSLTSSEDELSAYVFVPPHHTAELVSLAQSGRVQIIHFTANKLRYRSALIRGVSVDTHFEAEDW